jgi:hypothetical protein
LLGLEERKSKKPNDADATCHLFQKPTTSAATCALLSTEKVLMIVGNVFDGLQIDNNELVNVAVMITRDNITSVSDLGNSHFSCRILLLSFFDTTNVFVLQ